MIKLSKDKTANTPHTHVNTRNFIHQADTLYLPHDKKFKYAVVVVDLATSHMDAKPVRTKNSTEAARVIKEMYKGPWLKQPKELEVDQGAEFKGDFKDNFKGMKIRTKKTGRHRAQAQVESTNSLISRLLNRMMIKDEHKKGKSSSKWVEYLPLIVKEVNELLARKPKEINTEKNMPTCEGRSCKLLEVGTKVRTILELPKDFTSGKRQGITFREGDMRWSNKHQYVTQILIRPSYPPMYLVDDGEIGYTRNQLQNLKQMLRSIAKLRN